MAKREWTLKEAREYIKILLVSGFKTPRVSFKEYYTKNREKGNKVEYGN